MGRARRSCRLGLFGGTFDPPHWGHCLLAERAVERFKLDRLLFIPCRQSPLKAPGGHTDGPLRMAMVRAAVRGKPWAGVADLELRRAGPSYTIDTVRAMERLHPGARLYWLLGADQWEALEDWKEWRELARRVTFLVFWRGSEPRARRGVRHGALRYGMDLSATEIRRRVRRGLPVDFYVPGPVAKFIGRRGIYRS